MEDDLLHLASKNHCASAACHEDVIDEKVQEIVVVLHEERELRTRTAIGSQAPLLAVPTKNYKS